MTGTAFFAYPGGIKLLDDAIKGAARLLESGSSVRVLPWSRLEIIGLKLDDLIRDEIAGLDFLVADITYPNFNVYYEVGYAIGRGKPFVLSLNTAVAKAHENAYITGLFDTVGWATYQNSEELAAHLRSWKSLSWSGDFRKPRNHSQPLFFLDLLSKIDFRNYITQTISNHSVQYRMFDPTETPRMVLSQAIADISSSAGVIVPLVSPDLVDSERHNLRAAFLAGLSHGYGIKALLIQYEDKPAPLDYRDEIKTGRGRREVEQDVGDFCQATLIRNQQIAAVENRDASTILGKIDLGSSVSENELQKLNRYFVKTAEYQRALRSDGAIVAGRKGSGKSAIFFQAAEEYGRDKRNLILELKPSSHSLSELRENLLSVLSAGLFDHTIAAFWQYIAYTEIMLRLRESVLPKAKFNLTLLQKIRDIEEQFGLTDDVVAGDFTSRLELAVRSVISTLKEISPTSEIKSRLTNLLFESKIPKLRDAVVSLAQDHQAIFFLLDNLDKGWPAKQIEKHDISTVRHLIEVLNRIQRDLQRRSLEFKYLIFLRSDVYENLVEETADRGKYSLIRVDWSDPKQLEHLVRERVVAGVERSEGSEAWGAVNPMLNGGGTALSRMIGSCLMRPRFLIDLCERTLSFAINRGHQSVEEDDVEDALEQMSLYLVSDFGYEIRDIAGVSADIFYSFIGLSEVLTTEEVAQAIKPMANNYDLGRLIDLLLWYGFLGISGNTGESIFIYDREYDFRRLSAERDQQTDNLLYVVNPAFLKGLHR